LLFGVLQECNKIMVYNLHGIEYSDGGSTD
jgi:hypothetical protein